MKSSVWALKSPGTQVIPSEAPLSRVGRTIRSATKIGATNKLRLVSGEHWQDPQAVQRVSALALKLVVNLECHYPTFDSSSTVSAAIFFCSSSKKNPKSSWMIPRENDVFSQAGKLFLQTVALLLWRRWRARRARKTSPPRCCWAACTVGRPLH